MENIKNLAETTVDTAIPLHMNAATAAKSFQDFINVLSQIIEKHGAEILNELSRVE